MAESTLVLVLTDVEGSTRLWADHPDAMDDAMRRHHEIVHAAVGAHGGWRPVDQGEGDAVLAAFESAAAALEAVVGIQRELAVEPWPDGIELRDRIGVHAGGVIVRDGNLFGSTVNRAARLRSLGAGGQVLLSAPVFELVRDRLPAGVSVVDLGEHRMKDLVRPEHVHQVRITGLPDDFPPLADLDRARHNLPLMATAFVGRTDEVREITAAVERERLVTVLGFGGIGKTRLALQIAAELASGDGDGVWFVDLSSLDDPAAIPSAIASAVGLRGDGVDGLDGVLSWLDGKRLLLVLDNLEQLLPDGAAVVDRLRRAGPDVHLLITSREPLRLQGERVVAIEPLPVPPTLGDADAAPSDAWVAALPTYPAVELFLERALAARRDFTLTPSSAAAVAAIVARVDGLPLAIELVAARLRALSPQALLPRLENALSILTGGGRDLPSRQQTLRATIAWSTRSLDPDHELLLQRLSVFPASFTLGAAEAICGPGHGVGPDVDAFGGVLELVDRSLVRIHPATGSDDDRYDLLLPVKEFAAEQLARSGEAAVVQDAHADHFLALVRLPPQWRHDDFDVVEGAVRRDRQNILRAFDRLHVRGDGDAEVALVPWVSIALDADGRTGDGASLVQHAMTHVGPDDDRPSAVLLRTADARWIARTEGGRAATDAAAAALAAAERLGDATLIVWVAYMNSLSDDPLGRDPELLRAAGALLDAVDEETGAVPGWLVRDVWDEAAVLTGLVSGRPAAEVEARLIAATHGWNHHRLTLNFAAGRLRASRVEEAAAMLRRYEREEELQAANAGIRTNLLALLAELQIATGSLSAADEAQRRAEALAAVLDMPAEDAYLTVQHAAIDRMRGSPDRATVRLERMLARRRQYPGDSVAYARWLLAVLAREDGDLESADRQLRAAWDIARVERDPDLRWRCVAERAVQSLDRLPASASRFAADAIAHSERPTWHLGHFYDLAVVRDRAEAALGGNAFDAMVGARRSVPLELAAWEEDAATE